ncbi:MULTISPECIES: response regulator [unclassified Halorhabdus]|uniref:response regulator n=1 Tax=unclassified Halorhabdus TaxID=2621901 RepID=UPI0023DC7B1B|nr:MULTISPECIES: response regulator [unclassified Halorhabdus]WEL17728.1 Signal transduction histidine kinase [Halorhabdus sp. SVX81]WEL21606.1 Signal transduction histidine kinase, contains REC and PAS domains [Halorhabdus sp. BNX81]
MPDEITVFLVDEDRDILDITATFLERADDDLDVRIYQSATEALRTIESDPTVADCVISDYTMPELSGAAFLEAVRGVDSDMPFFVFSGREREDVEAQLDEESFTGYIKKGAGTEQYAQLAAEIRSAVEE